MACSKKPLVWALAAVGVIAVAFAAHMGMAYRTVQVLNSAREAGDADAFSAQVDYPALRESFKATMGENLDATAQATPAIVRPMVLAMNRAILNTLTDNLITPRGVAQIMAQGKVPTARTVDAPANGMATPSAPSGGAVATPPPAVPRVSTGFRDLSTLGVVYNDGNGRALTLLIKAEGPFDWKLAGIEIPVPDAIKAAAKAKAAQATGSAPTVPATPAATTTPLGQVPGTASGTDAAR